MILLGFFGIQLSNANYLAKIPIQSLFKEQFHLGAAAISFFWLVSGIAWYCKPIAGILTDALPFFGTRRRHYLLFSSAVAGAIWVAIGLLPPSYSMLMWTNVLLNCFIVMCSTVMGGFLVEAGQRMSATGPAHFDKNVRHVHGDRADVPGRGPVGEVRIAAGGDHFGRPDSDGVRGWIFIPQRETAIGS